MAAKRKLGFVWRKIVFSKPDVNKMIKIIHRSSNQSKDDSIVPKCRIWIRKTRCSDLLIVLHQRLTYTVFHISQSCRGWWYVPCYNCNELCGAKTRVPGPCHLGSGHNSNPTSSNPNHLALAWFNPDHYLDVHL